MPPSHHNSQSSPPQNRISAPMSIMLVNMLGESKQNIKLKKNDIIIKTDTNVLPLCSIVNVFVKLVRNLRYDSLIFILSIRYKSDT